jgi:hypothetical protein
VSPITLSVLGQAQQGYLPQASRVMSWNAGCPLLTIARSRSGIECQPPRYRRGDGKAGNGRAAGSQYDGMEMHLPRTRVNARTDACIRNITKEGQRVRYDTYNSMRPAAQRSELQNHCMAARYVEQWNCIEKCRQPHARVAI